MFDLPVVEALEIASPYEVSLTVVRPLVVALESGQQFVAPVQAQKTDVVTLPGGTRLKITYPAGYVVACKALPAGSFPEQVVDTKITSPDGLKPSDEAAIKYAESCSVTKEK